jgi:hypothetical protein
MLPDLQRLEYVISVVLLTFLRLEGVVLTFSC